MSCEIEYKKVSTEKIVFGYSCTAIDELFFEEERIVGSIKEYCEETNKKVETETFLTPFRDKYLLEIRVYK
jgi:thymidine kinase